jgi:hypothetical protein
MYRRIFYLIKTYIYHNCEHFAIWCKTGLTESTQLSIEGLAARFLRPKWGPLKWLANEIWRVEAEY